MNIPLGPNLIERARLRFRRVAVALAYKRVFGGEDGELVLHDIMRRGGVLRTGFDVRPGLTAFNEGRRSLALEIVRELALNEKDFERMARDIHNADQQSDE